MGVGRVVVANVMKCDTILNEFELFYRFYIQFRTNTHRKSMKLIHTTPKLCVEYYDYCSCKYGFSLDN